VRRGRRDGPTGGGHRHGGSIRVPAAYCGVASPKPTYDLVSRRGVFPLSWSLDHVGPIARSAGDAALLLRAMAGDRLRCGRAGRRLRGLRVGKSRTSTSAPTRSGVRAAFDGALRTSRARAQP
jgi:aspartyl-tRNA(Asn)/glutamyl-tRNA(Gln) amidotransferase subunit A